MKQIPLTQGYMAAVEDADYERLRRFKYHAKVFTRADGTKRVYAARTVRVEGRKITQFLHHDVLMGKPLPGFEVDHENGDGLTNTQTNLRMVTYQHNQANRRKTQGSSRFKGVSWHKKDKKWAATIKVGQRQIWLGAFVSEIDAAKAYNVSALEAFGPHALLNEID